MKIFLTWLGVICCGVANGFLYTRFGSPENLVSVLCASAVCAALLIIHRRITKNWKLSNDSEIEGFKFPFFRISLFFSVFILIMLFVLQEATTTGIVACISVALASLIGHTRERKYTERWIGGKISLKKEGSGISYLF